MTHNRRQRDGGHQARQDWYDVGDAKRPEELALDAGQCEQRNEDEYNDHCRVDNARSDFLWGIDNDSHSRQRVSAVCVEL